MFDPPLQGLSISERITTIYGRDGEAALLAYILKRPDLLHDYKDKLDKDHFRYSPAKFIFERFREKYNKHRQLPTQEECKELFQKHPKLQKESSIVQASVLGYVDQVYTQEVTAITGEFLGAFIIRQELLSLEESIQDVKGSEDFDTLEKAIEGAKDRIQHLQDIIHKKHKKGLSFPFDETGLSSLGRFMETSASEAIASGFSELDNRSRGGFRRGDVVLLSGQSGAGKTATLVSMSVQFVLDGLRVVYVALDNTERDIKERVYASFTGIPIENDLTISEYQEKAGVVGSRVGTRMIVQHLPSKSVNVTDLKRIIKDIQKELWLRNPADTKIDVVIVDYGDKVNTDKNYKDTWYSLGELFDSFVGAAQEDDQLWVVATQQNEEGKEYGSRAKRFAVAHNLALDQTPAEYHERHIRLKVLKNRYGPTLFQIPLEICYENQRVRERPDCGIIPIGGETAGTGVGTNAPRRSGGSSFNGRPTIGGDLPAFDSKETNGVGVNLG